MDDPMMQDAMTGPMLEGPAPDPMRDPLAGVDGDALQAPSVEREFLEFCRQKLLMERRRQEPRPSLGELPRDQMPRSGDSPGKRGE